MKTLIFFCVRENILALGNLKYLDNFSLKIPLIVFSISTYIETLPCDRFL